MYASLTVEEPTTISATRSATTPDRISVSTLSLHLSLEPAEAEQLRDALTAALDRR